ncbi:MAG: ribbon-helix-helix domain-containing protein [Candidatus Bathyarchaeota archaeon]|jgi:Arc/MetJ-type ribon-helix-helix transcriptional regulator|nr:ribbon-helix-helix domain-containing protein [Candidatus Termiticorpusculum sp.]
MKIKKEEKAKKGMKLVTVLLPEAHLEALDELVRMKMYQNRSAAIRNAVRDMVKQELWGSKKLEENKRGHT